MSDKSLAARLHVKPGRRLRLVNAPAGYPDMIGALPTGARFVDAGQPADVVQAFFSSQSQLTAQLPATLAESGTEVVLWICYPKTEAKVSDLSRQAVHNAIRLNGWKPVAQVNVDQTWSAIRARPGS